MATLPLRVHARALEDEVKTLWQRRGLPDSLLPSGGAAHPPTYLIGARALRPDDADAERLQHLLLADVLARYLRRAGREVREPIHVAPGLDSVDATWAKLTEFGGWFSRDDLRAPSGEKEALALVSMFDHLAHEGLLRAREAPFRFCPTCQELVPPSLTVYRERARPEYLIRFPVADRAPPLSLLVTVDAVWKLLGTVAAVLHPDRPYVRIELHRRGSVEEVLVARHALPALAVAWPGAVWRILEERPGSEWTGLTFGHPLATEAPTLGYNSASIGHVVTSSLVAERSTGIVPLVPAHGPEDATLAREHHLPAVEVVGASGTVLDEPRSLYSGLPVDTAEAFVARDLAADRSLVSEATVHRGVPHCAQCQTELIWRSARAWALELERAPPELFETLHRVIPGAIVPRLDASLPWPVSREGTSGDATAPQLFECPACGRLSPLADGDGPCACGQGRPAAVRRAALPEIASRWGVWGRIAPDVGDARLVVLLPARRRAAVLLEHMLGARAASISVDRLRPLVVAPPSADPPAGLPDEGTPVDAVRTELVRSTEDLRRDRSRVHGVREASQRLQRFWRFSARVQRRLKLHGFTKDPRALAAAIEELPPEDHAFLVRYYQFRGSMQVAAERGDWARVWDRWYAFFLKDLLAEYARYMMAPRMARQVPMARDSTDTVLDIVVPGLAEMIAPVAPSFGEGIWAGFHPGGSSLFEESTTQRVVPRTHRSDVAYEGCLALSRIAESARRRYGLGPESTLPRLVLIARGEADADRLRPHLEMIARVVGAEDVEIHSPQRPWTGRTIEVQLRTEEIRRTYPTQAARIQSILSGMEPRRLRDAVAAGRLAITVQGSASMPITPAMMDVQERLPEGYVALAWDLGEICLELPKGFVAPAPLVMHWSHDAENVRVDLARRLAISAAVDRPPDVAYVAAPEALRAELGSQAESLARELGIREIHVTPTHDMFTPRETTYGRTAREGRWWLWIPGNQVERRETRAKAPRPRLPNRRPGAVSGVTPDEEPPEAFIARGEGIRALVGQMDAAGVPPVAGAAKLGVAWDAGWKTVDSFARGDLPALAALQGFGPEVARAIIGNLAPSRDLGPTTPVRWVPPTPERAGPATPQGFGAVTIQRLDRSTEEGDAPLPTEVEIATPASTGATVEEIPLQSTPTVPEGLGGLPVPPPGIEPAPAQVPRLGTGETSPLMPSRPVPQEENPPPLSPPHRTGDVPSIDLRTAPLAEASPVALVPPVEPSVVVPPVDAESETPEGSGAEGLGSQSSPVLPPVALPAELDPGDAPAAAWTDGKAAPAADAEGLLDPVLVSEAAVGSGDDARQGPNAAQASQGPREVAGAPAGTTPSSEIEHSDPESWGSPLTPVEGDVPSPPENSIPESPGADAPGPQTGTPEESSHESQAPPPRELASAVLVPEAGPLSGEFPAVGVGSGALPDAPGPELDLSNPGTASAVPREGESLDGAAGSSDRGVPEAPIDSIGRVPLRPSDPVTSDLSSPPAGDSAAPSLFTPPVPESVPVTPAPVVPPAAPSPPGGGLAVATGPARLEVWGQFREALAGGAGGLWIGRLFPKELQGAGGSGPGLRSIFLTTTDKPDAIRPSNLPALAQAIQHAIEEEHVGVIVIEEAEYLVMRNGADAVLQLLGQVDAMAKASGARVWMPLLPELMHAEVAEKLITQFPGGR